MWETGPMAMDGQMPREPGRPTATAGGRRGQRGAFGTGRQERKDKGRGKVQASGEGTRLWNGHYRLPDGPVVGRLMAPAFSLCVPLWSEREVHSQAESTATWTWLVFFDQQFEWQVVK